MEELKILSDILFRKAELSDLRDYGYWSDARIF